MAWNWGLCSKLCTLFQFVRGFISLFEKQCSALLHKCTEDLFCDFGLDLPYAPGPLIIWKNFQSQICFRTIFEMHSVPGAYNRHDPRAVCLSNMVQQHIWLKYSVRLLMVPDHKVFFRFIWMIQNHKVLMVQNHINWGQIVNKRIQEHLSFDAKSKLEIKLLNLMPLWEWM